MHQCLFSIRGGKKHLILIILIIHLIVSYDQNNSFICERWIPCQASTSVLSLHYRPETVHCSTKDAYNLKWLSLHYNLAWSWILCTIKKVYWYMIQRYYYYYSYSTKIKYAVQRRLPCNISREGDFLPVSLSVPTLPSSSVFCLHFSVKAL